MIWWGLKPPASLFGTPHRKACGPGCARVGGWRGSLRAGITSSWLRPSLIEDTGMWLHTHTVSPQGRTCISWTPPTLLTAKLCHTVPSERVTLPIMLPFIWLAVSLVTCKSSGWEKAKAFAGPERVGIWLSPGARRHCNIQTLESRNRK